MLSPVFGLLGGRFTSGSALTQAALSGALVRRALSISSWWNGSGQTLKVSWSPFFQTLGFHQGHGHQMDQPDSPHPRPNTFPAERVRSRSLRGVGSLSSEGGAGLSFVPVRCSWGVLGQVPGRETQPFPEVFNRKSEGGGFTGAQHVCRGPTVRRHWRLPVQHGALPAGSQSPAWAPRGVEIPDFQDHRLHLNSRRWRDLESLSPQRWGAPKHLHL